MKDSEAMTYPAEFLDDIQTLMGHEGAFADRPENEDPGGFTGYGITLRTFNRYRALTNEEPVDKARMQDILTGNRPLILAIYFKLYWDRVAGHELPPSFRYMIFDIAVLEGLPGIKRLQKMLGLNQDGIVGQRTLSALWTRAGTQSDRMDFIEDLNEVRYNHLISRAHADKNPGWFTRLKAVKRQAYHAALAAQLPPFVRVLSYGRDEHLTIYGPLSENHFSVSVTPRHIEENTMGGTKNAFKSGTIWAGIAQLALAALGFFGVDIAPGDAELALSHVEALVIAVTGVITIWRRVSATTLIKT